jgi:hypothetical protein
VVLIFGWGQGSVDDRGEVAPVRCPNCHNDVFLHLVRSTKEVSHYFIPVMPYGTDEYLVCRVCGHGLHVALEHQTAVEGMRAATRLFREGRITEPDYRARTDRFWQTMGVALSVGGIPAASGGGPAPGGVPGQAPGPAHSSPSEVSLADRLIELARLRAAGILTDEEFDAAKRHLLER